jgi:hypothetical protein
MDIATLRKYRITLEPPSFNSNNQGIALFDLISTFIIAYILEPYLLPRIKISRMAYYLMLIPLGIVTHLFTKQDTFLNKQLFNETINIYKIIVIVILYKLYLELTI